MEQYFLEEIRICDLCGNSRLEIEFEVDDCTLLRCGRCGLVFTSPRYTEEYLKGMYSKKYYEKAPGYLSAQLQQPPEDLCRLALSIKKRFTGRTRGRALRSLDVGCGAGSAVAAFKRAGWEAIGIDMSETAINAGKGQDLDLRALEIADIAPQSFDVVTAFHVLEHVSSPRQFLNQCAMRLVPQGILVIDVPNYGSRNARNLRQHWPNLYPRLHLYQFTAATLKTYLARLNLEKLSMEKVNGYGPAEDYTSVPGAHLRPRNRIKETLQKYRHMLFLVPGAKPFLRWLFWQVLGYGESIRVLCRKN